MEQKAISPFFFQFWAYFSALAWKHTKTGKNSKLKKNGEIAFCTIIFFYHRIMSFYPILTLIPYSFCIFSILFKSEKKVLVVCLFPSNCAK